MAITWRCFRKLELNSLSASRSHSGESSLILPAYERRVTHTARVVALAIGYDAEYWQAAAQLDYDSVYCAGWLEGGTMPSMRMYVTIFP